MGRPAINLPNKICRTCGRAFNRSLFGKRLEDATRYQKRKYCTKSCASFRKEAMTNKSVFSSEAQALRKNICEACGSRSVLVAHHINGNITENHPSNIMTLCQSCHSKLHWSLRKRGVIHGWYSEPSKHELLKLMKLSYQQQRLEKTASKPTETA